MEKRFRIRRGKIIFPIGGDFFFFFFLNRPTEFEITDCKIGLVRVIFKV